MEDFPNTIVFWNSEDYPIPCGAHLSSAIRNIEEALNRKGFHGFVDIQAYGDHLNQVELRKAQITYFEPETSRGLSSAVSRMPIDMIQDAATSADPPTFMVIAKHPEREWHRVLQCLQSRNHTVLVLEPPDDTAFDDVETLVQCTRVPQILEARSKIQDFSEPLTHAKGDKTVVFWDVVDCPFPTRCSDADEIFRKIDKALSPWGETSIWAYVDESSDGAWSGECLRDKTWDSRIYFLPGGESRPQRMLNDILLLLSLDSPAERYTTRLVVVSDQITDDTYFFDRLEYFSDNCVFVNLVTPTRDINDPDSTDWPQLLIDEAYFFEPSPETHEEDAQVFWNLEDYPIPDGFRLPSFRRNIEKALKRMGFGGHTYFQAYGDRLNHGRAALRKARVEYFLPEGGDYSAVSRMPLDMIMHAATTGPSTFLIIAKQSPEREWRRVLQCLQSRNHTAIVVDDTAQSLKSVVKRIRVLDGEKPISKSSKIQDFSEPITHAKGDNTAVFWDVVDCPFPLCSDPDEIYRRIEEALRGSGCTAEISIWAYVDENNDGPWSGEFLRNRTWDSRIYFLPGGASRPERMLNDMFLWEMDCLVDHSNPAKMILVSDQVREGTDFFRTYEDLNGTSGFRVSLVTPTQDVNKAESPEWPRLLLAETAILFGSKSELIEHAAEEVIQVFWNSDDYPFPDKYDFCSIVLSIDEDLEEMGFNGIPEIWAYGDHPNDGIERLSKTGITYHLSESSIGDCSADSRMPLDMLLCAATRGPSKFLVIAKQRPEGELQRVQQCLKSRNHTVVLVDDTAQDWSILSLADCTQVLGGGEVSQVLRESKSLDTERTTGEQTAVFWNLEDVPFPRYCDPDLDHPDIIYHKMVYSLRRLRPTVYVYVHEKEGSWYLHLRDKTWDSRIYFYFLPGGASGRNRMLNDILLWHMDSPNEHSDPPQLIVVSDYVYSPSLSRMWDYLQSTCHYRVRFVTSRPGHVEYLSCSGSESESESSEPNPKRRHEIYE
ncbi:unnamed protein product [Thlaspi arvense]|uniref:NYN domain-containing protein n=1 Tax=Thlaspi arvense TaxID=13288 RepID=A0AAU9SSJ1_THLAR|nr:unnamed protein product [Thlaspi arvense]